MYTPFLRARAHELRALERISDIIRMGSVLPILEPVNASAELWKKLRYFAAVGMECCLIVNPPKGKLGKDPSPIHDAFSGKNLRAKLNESDAIIPTFQVRPDIEQVNVETFLEGYQARQVALVIDSSHIDLSQINTLISQHGDVRLVAIGDKMPSTYLPKVAQDSLLVKIEDAFVKAENNASYPDDEFFSDLVSRFADLGFDGFGDYTILEKGFKVPSGSGPVIAATVAIHFTYEKGIGKIWVKHFKSDDRDEQIAGEVPKKTRQALTHFHDFVSTNGTFCGRGCSSFLEAYHKGETPKGGPIKEDAMAHHIELMNSILLRENNDGWNHER